MAWMGYFFSASLACVMSHPEVTMETDVSVMRSATSFSGQPNERVVFMLSCKHTRRVLPSGRPQNVCLAIPLSGMTLVACQPNVFKTSLRQTGATYYERSVC